MAIDKLGKLYPQTEATAKQHTGALIPRQLFSYAWKSITSSGALGDLRIHTDLENTTNAGSTPVSRRVVKLPRADGHVKLASCIVLQGGGSNVDVGIHH